MVRPTTLLSLVASRFECVRVTDMAGVDLDRHRFDFDLTSCILLQRADGHRYHTFGGRTWEGAESHLSVPALVRVLVRTLEEHEKAELPPRGRSGPGRTVEALPPLARRIEAGRRPACIHCHSVHDWQVEAAKEAKRWRPQDGWVFPDPREFGFSVDPIEQERVVSVEARVEGLQVGDRILAIEGTPVLTFGDIVLALDRSGDGPSVRMRLLPVSGGPSASPVERVVSTSRGWREPDPLLYSWRAMKWNLDPSPGFGGPPLTARELGGLGHAPGPFAFRVQYLVDGGARAETGRSAARAGLRVGDVVLSLDGRSDFRSVDHVHAWFRLTRRAGETVILEVLREGERRRIDLPVVGLGR
ncbi:MAG: PDZ domain-containing protein [Planctomycetota bacterium]